MSRTLTGAFQTAMAEGLLRPAIFVELQFSGGTVRVWSGVGSITWNSQTWTGVGNFGGMSPVQETADVQANSVKFSLSGIPSQLISAALGEVRVGAPVTAWLGLLSTSDWSIIADPAQIFSGLMDVPVIDEGADTATISITVENRLIQLERAAERRYTDEDQRQEYPGDRGFEYVASLQDAQVTWG